MHKLTFKDGVPQFAYVGEDAWHGLGVQKEEGISPADLMKAAGLDYTVSMHPSFYTIKGDSFKTGQSALVRDDQADVSYEDEKGEQAVVKGFLGMVSDDWVPVQNSEAFDFFTDLCAEGGMSMNTAGSLRGGKIVFGLAKVGESFELKNGKKRDLVENHLLFSNFFIYGRATDVRMTPTRVVCDNTISIALKEMPTNFIKQSHRAGFNAANAKEIMGLAAKKFEMYHEACEALVVPMKGEDIVDFFMRVFPNTSTDPKKKTEASMNAKRASAILESQPGADFAPGTMWNAVNAVTFLVDHGIGSNDDVRADNAWYGNGMQIKNKAMKLALDLVS